MCMSLKRRLFINLKNLCLRHKQKITFTGSALRREAMHFYCRIIKAIRKFFWIYWIADLKAFVSLKENGSSRRRGLHPGLEDTRVVHCGPGLARH